MPDSVCVAISRERLLFLSLAESRYLVGNVTRTWLVEADVVGAADNDRFYELVRTTVGQPNC